MNVLYEDNHLLVVVKPAGLATMGLPAGEETLFTQAKKYIKAKYNKPGEVYLGVVSRLDVAVSGVVVFARTSKAAARLNDQFRQHTAKKTYLALVEGKVFPPEADCVDRLFEDKQRKQVWLTRDKDSKEARLHYRKIRPCGKDSLLEIQLLTGRKHQIRLQLSHRGHPIVGDKKYGAKTPFQAPGKKTSARIALHAWKLEIAHPTTRQTLCFEAPPPLALDPLVDGRGTECKLDDVLT